MYEIENTPGPGRGWLRLLIAVYLNREASWFFSEKELQMHLGLSSKSFRSLLLATGNPTLEIVEHLATMLNVPVWRLFYISDKSIEKDVNANSLNFNELACKLYGDLASYQNCMREMQERDLAAKRKIWKK